LQVYCSCIFLFNSG